MKHRRQKEHRDNNGNNGTQNQLKHCNILWVFSCENFSKFLRTTFFTKHLQLLLLSYQYTIAQQGSIIAFHMFDSLMKKLKENLICQFLNIPIIYYQKKIKKKQLRKIQSDTETDSGTENSDFMGLSGGL